MDGELLKSTRDDQMDMIMMMQMNKVPDICGPFANVGGVVELPSIDFCGGTPRSVFDALPLTSPPLINQIPSSSSPLQFAPSMAQEPVMPTAIFHDRLATGRLEGMGAFPSAEAPVEPGQKRCSVASMREMIFRVAAVQPIHIDPESVKPPKRRNVKISKDPQSVAARHRRERISQRIRILQRLVPGGTKLDTASMLDEAIHYVKFLKTQVQSLERAAANRNRGFGLAAAAAAAGMSSVNQSSFAKAYHPNSQSFGATTQLLR